VTCGSSQTLSLPCSRLTPLCCGPETCPVGVKSTNIHLSVDHHKAEAAKDYLLVLSVASAEAFSVDAEAVVAKVEATTTAATVRARLAEFFQAVASKKRRKQRMRTCTSYRPRPLASCPLTPTRRRPRKSGRRTMGSCHNCLAPL